MDNFSNNLITYIGIPAIIGGVIWLGRKLIWIGKQLQVLNDMQSSLNKIKHNLKVVCDSLIKSDINFDHEKLQSYSPLGLTEKGSEFIKEVKFDEIFAQNKDSFYEFISSENPKTLYDIEVASIKAVFVLFDEDYFFPVKDYLYKNPTAKKNQVMQVLGIFVRDNYMEDKNKK